MAISKIHVTQGLWLWSNSADPAAKWLEMGRGKAEKFILGSSALALAATFAIPAPAGLMVSFVVLYWRDELRDHVGPKGIWIKGQPVIIPGEERPRRPVVGKRRTAANMMKEPNPW